MQTFEINISFHYETYTVYISYLFVNRTHHSSPQNEKGLLKIPCFLVRCYLFFRFTFFEEATWFQRLHFQPLKLINNSSS